ncbi:MAG: helix-turn-helix transcriptional regulator [Lachnospiraceae bacterium]|nr:helix-turn-helix transcriptional regulator [Lachnospiraceae bacterium]
MPKINFRQRTNPQRSIVRWFIICFICFSLIFLIALFPLISYCRSVFTELEIKKSTQQMDFGISQLENTVTGVVSASQSLTDDIRFLPFHYQEPDYSAITVPIRNQMKEYLKNLLFPLKLISDSALQFSESLAISPELTMFDEYPGYYPYHFSVDDLTYGEWETLLQENKSGFLSVHHVTTPAENYDALIYAIRWTKNAYFYACLDITDVKQALIAEEDLGSYCLTIENSEGDCLYTDLSDTLSDYHSVTQKTSHGGLTITVHIPEASLTERMSPLYYFLGLYLTLCVLALIITVFVGSHLSSKPLVRIVGMLENSNVASHSPADKAAFPDNTAPNKTRLALDYGFHYILNKVQSYESSLNAYRSTIDTQTKVLQARFLEKALHGSLVTDKDYESFFSYFPGFPNEFCLILMGLVETPVENENVYPEALTLVQCYLQNNLSGAYLQQLNSSELLLIIDEKDIEAYSRIINHLMENINREEPCYHAWGIASKFYDHPKNIPAAYGQLQDLYSRVSLESLSQLCTVSDHPASQKPSFRMADTLNIYTAITYGNKDVALLKLEDYADNLNARSRSVFEMFRSILLCIKQEYASQLVDVAIPAYHSRLDMYAALKETISVFCDELQQLKQQRELDPFIQEVKAYIDLHFTEDDLCHASLGEHFHCSPSKIQKAFPKEMGISLSAYIEKKRMELANELLLRGEYSVTEVARKCGFSNDNTFYKAYRRTFGHAPTSLKQG